MFQLSQDKGVLKLVADSYRLTFAVDRPYVYVDDAQGARLVDLFVLSSIHPLQGRDDTCGIGSWEVEESPHEVVFTLHAASNIWRSKTYRFRCWSNRFVYEPEVDGIGQLSEVHYFGGYYSGHLRWGSGYFWSGGKFLRGFNPDPNMDEQNYFTPQEGSMIDLMGVPLPGKAGWFFTPAPFCFAFEYSNGWLGMGVEAQPDANRFTEYVYHGQHAGFDLSLSYEGHTAVNGRYKLPRLGFDFAKSEYQVLAAHVLTLREKKYVAGVFNKQKPAWWYEPIFCGWGEQCYLAELDKGRAPDYSRQDLYEQFIATLASQNVCPGIVVLDDKWQAAYGENEADPNKWPNLPGFIRQRHVEGKKVLLWLKAWDPEGIPVEECITNAAGLPLSFDPSNPAFEARLRHSVRKMLSPDGYDADGFKIDFTARVPSGPGIHTYGDVWGLELMRLYLSIIYAEAKKTKPDALVMTHTPHPYLADVTDMIRLNDINKDKAVIQAMTLRAQVVKVACPEIIIDTDNWPIPNRKTWREYLKLQPDLGVPSLYYATHIDATKEPLEEEDYRLIREAWDLHRKRCEVAK
jgi:hypothetical protein